MQARCLSNWDQGVRAQYIELLAQLCGTDSKSRTQQERIQELLCQFVGGDNDARVRSVRSLSSFYI